MNNLNWAEFDRVKNFQTHIAEIVQYFAFTKQENVLHTYSDPIK